MPEEFWFNAIYSLVPTIALGLIFWFVIRAIIRSDRTERKAYAKVEAEERAKAGLSAAQTVGTGSRQARSAQSPTPEA
ncbi:hypothetical protein PYV02_00100 [Leifsonia sp. H3M29-4]|uniref:hypothetical protein n=1 Tax=Salinibacterium metalliresistens TaxID=3031321 RepID=UPI0023DB65D2|nr:hypothetical protein [Salinibacterium metalliresistens]MDF1477480.1 hypothetical protein [Salinibacterium metalliresistens]